MKKIGAVIEETSCYFDGFPRRVNHFLKVYGFAKTIGELENLTEKELEILEVAAVVHDIGIKNSEIKYHSMAGKYQEQEGPTEARIVLEKLGYGKEMIERVEYLIAHHHTYDHISERDYQILVEADFLVNISEDGTGEEEIRKIEKNIFRTKTGIRLLNLLYLEGRRE